MLQLYIRQGNVGKMSAHENATLTDKVSLELPSDLFVRLISPLAY